MVVPTLIKEHMEVLGSDGAHVGTVEHMEGADEIKLTKDDRDAAGEDHYIPLAWVVHAEMKPPTQTAAATAEVDVRASA